MFNAKTLRQNKLSRSWWMLLIVAGVALFYFLNQTTPPALPTTNPTPMSQPDPAPLQTETGPSQEKETETSYLSEYDPDANPMLESAPTDKQEWELGIDVVIKLALVLALVYISMIGLRWLKKGKTHHIKTSATINVLETTGLAPGRSLHLVVVGEKTLLLGATDNQISLLAELPDAAVPLPEETEDFARVMSAQTEAAADELPPHLKSLDDPARAGESVTYELDWHSALAGARAGIRRMQESVGG